MRRPRSNCQQIRPRPSSDALNVSDDRHVVAWHTSARSGDVEAVVLAGSDIILQEVPDLHGIQFPTQPGTPWDHADLDLDPDNDAGITLAGNPSAPVSDDCPFIVNTLTAQSLTDDQVPSPPSYGDNADAGVPAANERGPVLFPPEHDTLDRTPRLGADQDGPGLTSQADVVFPPEDDDAIEELLPPDHADPSNASRPDVLYQPPDLSVGDVLKIAVAVLREAIRWRISQFIHRFRRS